VQQATDSETLRQELDRLRERAQRLEQGLVEAQRLATAGQLAGSMAHEFNNLLTMIIGRAEQALKHGDPARREQALRKTIELGERAGEIVRSLLAYATGRQTESRLVRADALLDAAVALVAWHLPKQRIELVRRYETDARVRVVPVRMEHVLLNLLLNALRAMESGGTLTVAAAPSDAPGYVALSVSDTGHGIAPEHLERIFEPFFTTARTDENGRAGGTGLGLSVARDLMRQAGGEIRVASRPGEGATFTVVLPVADEDS
jgi:two-component system NtrC family sensor kinase